MKTIIVVFFLVASVIAICHANPSFPGVGHPLLAESAVASGTSGDLHDSFGSPGHESEHAHLEDDDSEGSVRQKRLIGFGYRRRGFYGGYGGYGFRRRGYYGGYGGYGYRRRGFYGGYGR